MRSTDWVFVLTSDCLHILPSRPENSWLLCRSQKLLRAAVQQNDSEEQKKDLQILEVSISTCVTLCFFNAVLKSFLMIFLKALHVVIKLMIECVFESESQKAAHSDIFVTWREITVVVFFHFTLSCYGWINNMHVEQLEQTKNSL